MSIHALMVERLSMISLPGIKFPKPSHIHDAYDTVVFIGLDRKHHMRKLSFFKLYLKKLKLEHFDLIKTFILAFFKWNFNVQFEMKNCKRILYSTAT